MKSFFSLFILVCLSSTVSAQGLGLSPVRSHGESYFNARLRHAVSPQFVQNQENDIIADAVGRYISAENAQKPLQQLNIFEIADVGSYENLEKEFQYIRDTRFLTTSDASFPRRLTWLYPDDGCYARAEVAKNELVLHQFFAPKKIFVFGDLSASTNNSLSGVVEWWYHVAVTYRVAEQVYVFDPSIEPQRPLTLNEWNLKVGGNQTDVKYSICSADTFDPRADCVNPRAIYPAQARAEQSGFLQPEWNRLLRLQRDPKKELGDEPPWLHP